MWRCGSLNIPECSAAQLHREPSCDVRLAAAVHTAVQTLPGESVGGRGGDLSMQSPHEPHSTLHRTCGNGLSSGSSNKSDPPTLRPPCCGHETMPQRPTTPQQRQELEDAAGSVAFAQQRSGRVSPCHDEARPCCRDVSTPSRSTIRHHPHTQKQ
ncbi:hypothetical protein STCU_10238 [Strigomonas culicis]|uniref:Uncharacterized protein n=1 Tax=Strigomonas culicis TaxID=28005 RepID=S9V579_9TRYP|nr:hypothetical protein STCU_10238 [Strigomonas culicis]|eukprot:EPY18035.1 hypothetical protein STCU_10238 [Strigomonas culicis]